MIAMRNQFSRFDPRQLNLILSDNEYRSGSFGQGNTLQIENIRFYLNCSRHEMLSNDLFAFENVANILVDAQMFLIDKLPPNYN